MFIRSLFVLFFFCRPLYCVRFEFWLLVTPLVQQQSTLERPIDCMNTMLTLTVDILDELYSEFIPSRCKFRRECGNDDYEYTICCSRCCCLMVFNATFNNIPVISWRSVFFFLVEETGVPGKNHRPVVSHWQTLSHKVFLYINALRVVYRITRKDCVNISSLHVYTCFYIVRYRDRV